MRQACAARKGSIRNLYYRWSKEFLEAGKKRLDTMPSSPSLQAWAKTVGPSPSICSLNRMPELDLGTIDASVALRTSSGAPQVVAVQLDQVEGVQERTVIMAAVANEIERGNAVVIAGDSLAVDDARARTQACQRFDYQREAVGEVITRTAVEPHLRAILAGDNPKTVVLDLMQPLAAGGQLIGFGREARRDEPGREGTLQHAEMNMGSDDCNSAELAASATLVSWCLHRRLKIGRASGREGVERVGGVE